MNNAKYIEIKTNQEKAIEALNEAQNLIVEIQDLQTEMYKLESYKREIASIIKKSNERYWSVEQLNNDAQKAISVSLDRLESQLEYFISSCDMKLDQFNYWYQNTADKNRFDKYGGAEKLHAKYSRFQKVLSAI